MCCNFEEPSWIVMWLGEVIVDGPGRLADSKSCVNPYKTPRRMCVGGISRTLTIFP